MHKLRFHLALAIGKSAFWILRLLGKGGQALPGLIALKLDKKFLADMGKDIRKSIVISGTNGKTTTSRLISSALKEEDVQFFHNRTGSNLERGIASELIANFKFNGLPKNRIGLWEVDEAAFPKVALAMKPKVIVLTNLFRDQLDRYGEIDTIAKKWSSALQKFGSDTTVILNSDDPTVAALGSDLKCKIQYFGIRDNSIGTSKLSHASDSTACPKCLKTLSYKTCFVSHLGEYSCDECGDVQPRADIQANNIDLSSGRKLKFNLEQGEKRFKISMHLPAVYNVYNALAAFAGASSLGVDPANILKGFATFRPAFGRMETIQLKDKALTLMLVKNPTGFDQVLSAMPSISQGHPSSCMMVLNDNIADGKDVSWIWDVDMECGRDVSFIKNLIASGIRAEDMALRLKYSSFNSLPSKPLIQNDIEKSIDQLLQFETRNLFILATYTSMLAVRKALHKKGLVHKTAED